MAFFHRVAKSLRKVCSVNVSRQNVVRQRSQGLRVERQDAVVEIVDCVQHPSTHPEGEMARPVELPGSIAARVAVATDDAHQLVNLTDAMQRSRLPAVTDEVPAARGMARDGVLRWLDATRQGDVFQQSSADAVEDLQKTRSGDADDGVVVGNRQGSGPVICICHFESVAIGGQDSPERDTVRCPVDDVERVTCRAGSQISGSIHSRHLEAVDTIVRWMVLEHEYRVVGDADAVEPNSKRSDSDDFLPVGVQLFEGRVCNQTECCLNLKILLSSLFTSHRICRYALM